MGHSRPLLAIASVNPNANGVPLMQRHPYGRREIRSHYRPLASMLTWLSTACGTGRSPWIQQNVCR